MNVRWNDDAEMIEIISESDNFFLHPDIDFKADWNFAHNELTRCDCAVPSIEQFISIFKFKDEINDLILEHHGKILNDNYYWTSERYNDKAKVSISMKNCSKIAYDIENKLNVRGIKII